MIKRVTNITGLVVIAASIISMVPAIAAENYQTVEAKDGVIYDAKSLAGGRFIIDGEINGSEDRAMYYLADGKYTKLDDAETGDKIGDVCNGKYLELTDALGRIYYVDVTTGKMTNDYNRQAENMEITSKIRRTIKKDNNGRFAYENFTTDLVTADTTVRGDGSGEETMWGISGQWRQFEYKLDEPFISGTDYIKDKDMVYSNPQGNYVDADYNLGKIVVNTTTGGSVAIYNTKSTYDMQEDGKHYQVKAQIKNLRTWDEGPEYIVRTAALTIWRKEKGASDESYQNITDQVELGSVAHHYMQSIGDDKSVTVLQRISKAQAQDSVDGIKYPKTVETYFVTDKDGKPQPLLALGNGEDDIYLKPGLRVITGGTQGFNVSFLYDFINKKTYAETINYKNKSGYNYIDIDKYDDSDSIQFKLGCGDVWVLGDRYVKRFNDKDNKFENLYKVDGGMNSLHCSLPTDVVVWNQDKKCYSIMYPSAPAAAQNNNGNATNTAVTTGAQVTAGWVKDENGEWSFNKADGTKAIGWINDYDIWYYLDEKGRMKTGWINDNGTWYYCNESGAMLKNTSIDGYMLSDNGAVI